MQDRVGTVVGGKYRLEKLLGEGGMGAVYAATQEGLNRKCAVKLLHEALSKDGNLVARFKREAEVAASLGHPNIVQVTDFGFADGVVWLVMDLLEGTALADAIERETLAPERVRFISSQVLSALQAAHERDIVHRDLKPDNIFLTSLSGVNDVVKLLDFGIARMTGEQSQKMTTTGQVLGTPAYMSPEQARGQKVDRRTDLYSLGVVMYEALSGHMPVSGSNYHELMFNIVGETPKPLAELVPGLPPGLVAIVERAMAKDVTARYQTAAEMRQDLEALGPVQATALPAARSVPPAAVPETRAATTDADAFAKTITPEAVAAIDTSIGRPDTVRETSRFPMWAGIAAVAVLGLAGAAFAFMKGGDTPEPVASVDAPPMETEAIAEDPEAETEAEAEGEEARTLTKADLEQLQALIEAQRASMDEEGTEATTEAVGAPDGAMSAMSAMSTMSSMSSMMSGGGGRPAALRAYHSEAHPSLPHRAGDKMWQDWSGNPIVWAACGGNGYVKEVYPVLARTRLRYGGSRNPRIADRETLRSTVNGWMQQIATCYRSGRASVNRGQRFFVTIDENGRVTDVRMHIYCPVPQGVQQCVDQSLQGEQITPGEAAPGEFEFNVDVVGA